MLENSWKVVHFNVNTMSINNIELFYIHCSVHHYNCFKIITNTMTLVDYPLFSGVVVIIRSLFFLYSQPLV